MWLSIAGTRYFRCRAKHGILAKPTSVAIVPIKHDLGDEYTIVPDLGIPADAGQQVESGRVLYHTEGQRWGPEGQDAVLVTVCFLHPPTHYTATPVRRSSTRTLVRMHELTHALAFTYTHTCTRITPRLPLFCASVCACVYYM